MKVKKLIKMLKKMPQNLEVYYGHGDNFEWEVAGNTIAVNHIVKENLRETAESIELTKRDQEIFESQDDEWVTITG